MAMRRDIGLVGLTFVAVGGVLGSGWLFAPLLASQLAGPAALLAWAIGAVAMLLLALTFAEISSMFPVAGGIARIPQFSHGRLLAMVLGWSAWAGYSTTAPIEVEAALRYADAYFPWLHDGGAGDLTPAGLAVAAVLLLAFTILNAFGVALFAKVNAALTWAKIIMPIVFMVAIAATSFETANFTAHGGFAPFGIGGVFAAVASGGVAFAFIGFRHAIDMAGETKNPQVTIPLALVLAVLICFVVYGGIQLVFIGALPAAELSGGWGALSDDHAMGPLGALATALGILWLVSLLNAAAVVSPFGGALVSVGSNGRLAMAIAENGVFPRAIAALNRRGVPVAALALNYVVAVVLFVTLPFGELVALNGAAIVLSFVVGPVAVVALRRLAPDFPRSFRLPAARVFGAAAFVVATLMIYWSGWETMWRLLSLIAVGLVLFLGRLALLGREPLDAAGAAWMLPYLAGLGALSLAGGFGGGYGVLPAPADTLAVAAFALAMYVAAVRSHLPQARFDRYLEEELAFELEEYGGADAAEAGIAREVAAHRPTPGGKAPG